MLLGLVNVLLLLLMLHPGVVLLLLLARSAQMLCRP
jgi:hypothetical protein